MDSIVYKNVLPWRGCEKLYLDTQSKDVFFIFRSEKSDEIEKISAHKCILSANSPVFRALFYGPHKQDGDIEIVDATPEVFKKFLEFFYRSQVKLTAETLPDVLILCKRYQLDDWQTVMRACSDISKSSLTLDKLCWGYKLAILSESEDLKSFCEEEIGKNAVEVFRSNNFLKCRPNLLRHILQLDTLNCAETEVFDGCMAWAKAECSRKGCDASNAQNIRVQLGDLFDEIHFGKMTHEEFQFIDGANDGLFSAEEFRNITKLITSKEDQTEKLKRCSQLVQNTPVEPVRIEPEIELDCYRNTVSIKDCSNYLRIQTSCLKTTFISNSQLLLKEISLTCESKPEHAIDISIYEDSIGAIGGLSNNSTVMVEFRKTNDADI